MSITINKIINQQNEISYLMDNIASIKDDIKALCSTLKPEDISDMSYEELKDLYPKIKYSLLHEFRTKYEDFMREKRIEKYPALKQATYYQQINQLNIPDKEKVRLDKIVYKFYRHNISEKRLLEEHNLTKDILDTFVELGIATEHVMFKCPRCGMDIYHLEKEVINKHMRYWELKNLNTLTEEQEKEFEELWEDDKYCYGYINCECYNCDSYDGEDTVRFEICNREQYDEALNDGNIENIYSFNAIPDLTYEKL